MCPQTPPDRRRKDYEKVGSSNPSNLKKKTGAFVTRPFPELDRVFA